MFYFLKTGMKNLQHLTSIKPATENIVDFVACESVAGDG